MDSGENTFLIDAARIVNGAGTGITQQQRTYLIEAIATIQKKRALLRQELLRVYREPYSPTFVRQRIIKVLEGENGQMNDLEKQQPYIVEMHTTYTYHYNPRFGDERMCHCGHSYIEHFDKFEQYNELGCKQNCKCGHFRDSEEKSQPYEIRSTRVRENGVLEVEFSGRAKND